MNNLQSSPIIEYQKFFPHFTPSCYQQDLIETFVTDLDVWRETLMFWAGNDYRPQSIAKMLDYYAKYQKPISLADVLKAYPDKDARLVEIATLQVLMNMAEPVKSVNYFKPAIDEIYSGIAKAGDRQLSISSGTIDAVLARRRKQYDSQTHRL